MSHFHPWIDGSIVGLYLLGTMVAGVWVRPGDWLTTDADGIVVDIEPPG